MLSVNLRKLPEYNVYNGMLSRCNNKNAADFYRDDE